MTPQMAAYRDSEELLARIEGSELLDQYRTAFEAATGLPLEIHGVDTDFSPAGSAKANPFCRILNEHNRCPDCASAAHCIVSELQDKPLAFKCFACMSESAVPILVGRLPVAYLTTGQVFTREVGTVEWKKIAERLRRMNHDPDRIAELAKAWRETRTVVEEQYEGMVTLLAVFAAQLSELAEKLVLEQKDSEPETVLRARQYVSAHLADRIDLADVAGHVGMSSYHFCKVFKRSTGLTFKQYLTRRRVEWAKCRLRKPDARVTEVAYDVGFGSLSQFNRSFLQLAGISPSEWRLRESRKLSATA
ncbi:MAG: helix-turn-helix domain-containing protein [Verrucomicrobiales bacterium]